mgnify:FL=1
MANGIEFQSTPPHGGRLKPVPDIQKEPMFQSTPPHGGRQKGFPKRSPFFMFQSTPPHGGRRAVRCVHEASLNVSIHAPAWGATAMMLLLTVRPSRFNPRPRMGGDSIRRSSTSASQHSRFNPRPRMGGDLIFHIMPIEEFFVSIHAPAWGATLITWRPDEEDKVSIHAPAWGATGRTFRGSYDQLFQSTPPHGGRHE